MTFIRVSAVISFFLSLAKKIKCLYPKRVVAHPASNTQQRDRPVQCAFGDMTSTSSTTRQAFDIEYVRLNLSSLVTRVKTHVSLETVRPLPVFLGLVSTTDDGVQLSEGAFTPPPTGSDAMTSIKARVRDNLTFFLSNYALVALMTALVVLLMHPPVVITLTALYAMWWFHGYLIVNELSLFRVPLQSVLTVQQRFYLLFGISVVVIVWTCFLPTIVFVLISGIIILCHAALRDTSHLREASQRGNKTRGTEEEVNESEGLLSKV
jgi:PRA1 family protein